MDRNITRKKFVSFSNLNTTFYFLDDYNLMRKGQWHLYAVDRERFRRRIESSKTLLEKMLENKINVMNARMKKSSEDCY